MTGVARVKVPATSANLGPGYDCAGLALALFDDVEVEALPRGELTIEVSGEGEATVARDESHLVIRAMAKGFAHAGAPMPGVHLKCTNRIPHGRGLGSSSAAIVAGLALARDLLDGAGGLGDVNQLVALATEVEGHPDNVAPAVLGGFTIAWTQDGSGKAIRLEPHPEIQSVVAIPSNQLETRRARELLPDSVPHADAALNAGRAALLVAAMTQRPDLLFAATEDKLHQDYRKFAYANSYALVAALREQGIAAVISGAGPTVLALGTNGDLEFAVQSVVDQLGDLEDKFSVLALAPT